MRVKILTLNIHKGLDWKGKIPTVVQLKKLLIELDADIKETAKITIMEIGGVTPLALPNFLPLWVDSKVMQRNSIVLGGGNRSSKIKISPKIFHYTHNTEIVEGLAN